MHPRGGREKWPPRHSLASPNLASYRSASNRRASHRTAMPAAVLRFANISQSRNKLPRHRLALLDLVSHSTASNRLTSPHSAPCLASPGLASHSTASSHLASHHLTSHHTAPCLAWPRIAQHRIETLCITSHRTAMPVAVPHFPNISKSRTNLTHRSSPHCLLMTERGSRTSICDCLYSIKPTKRS
jgi:hypothetical protein